MWASVLFVVCGSFLMIANRCLLHCVVVCVVGYCLLLFVVACCSLKRVALSSLMWCLVLLVGCCLLFVVCCLLFVCGLFVGCRFVVPFPFH